ncbi:hypothetical protein ONZ51_g4825 [Trametes cubensis]|uniref:Uncharacterized protein n=1 Tax=Trametes cubensis TaxID=1111947 RepID=A0AAD7XCM6_9APHY|nr:hypothetical protein ONZ51_g4825 [Trametes cubensis]
MLYSTLLFQVLIAATAIAIPASRERRARDLPRRNADIHSSQPNQVANKTIPVAGKGDAAQAEYSTNWAGAVLSLSRGWFTTVSGTFVVPAAREPVGASGFHSASVWVGIDGWSSGCDNILQTGIDVTTYGDGDVSYNAWYEWYPDYAHDFTDITIREGDTITAIVIATSLTSGIAMIINYSTGQEVLHTFSGQPPLCEQDAEWIVEDYTRNGQLVPFVDFDHVTFTGASAGGPILGPFGPGGAKVVDMQQDGRILAVAAADDSTVNVWYGLGIFGETLSNSSTSQPE